MNETQSSKESIFLVEKVPDIRKRLTQAVRAEKRVSHITAAENLGIGLKLLREGHNHDIIFISHLFERQDVMDFVSAAKNTKHGQDAAYIGIIHENQGGSSKIAEQLLRGVDGFLNVPFNIQMVHDVIGVALQIKRRNLINRVATASRLILADCMKSIDYAAYDAKYRNQPVAVAAKAKKGMALIKSFNPWELAVYKQVVLEMFSNVQIPQEFIYLNQVQDAPRLSENEIEFVSLKNNLLDEDWKKRAMTLDKIMRMEDKARDFVPDLLDLVHDECASCRRKAKLILTKLGMKRNELKFLEETGTVTAGL